MAARVGHGVDRRRAADDAAARAFQAAAAGRGLGFGKIHPVVLALEQKARPAERNLDPRIAVPAAGLEQQHPLALVLAQPVGQHAAGRAGADDDGVVGFLVGHDAYLIRHRDSGGGGPPRRAAALIFERIRISGGKRGRHRIESHADPLLIDSRGLRAGHGWRYARSFPRATIILRLRNWMVFSSGPKWLGDGDRFRLYWPALAAAVPVPSRLRSAGAIGAAPGTIPTSSSRGLCLYRARPELGTSSPVSYIRGRSHAACWRAHRPPKCHERYVHWQTSSRARLYP